MLFWWGTLLAETKAVYSTAKILSFIEQGYFPEVTLSAVGRGGYGTSELLFETPQTDLYGGVLVKFDIVSSADRKRRQKVEDDQRRAILQELATIKEHLNLSWQYATQRTAYRERLSWYKKRVDKGLESHTALYPIEKIIIDLNAKIYKEQAEIQKAQLAIASYAGKVWTKLYDVVKRWDKKL